MADVLRKRPIIPARQYRDGAGTEATKLVEAVRIGQDIDGLELDRTDREKLFEFQTACSARLPEDAQCRIALHCLFSTISALRRCVPPVNIRTGLAFRRRLV